MIKCKYCGAELPDETKFCSSCGARIVTEYDGSDAQSSTGTDSTFTPEQPQYTYPPFFGKRPINGGMLAWSIVNTVSVFLSCCMILPFASFVLGVIAIAFTIQARSCATDEQEREKLRTAKILNIIASAIVVLSIILFIVLVIYGITSPVGRNYMRYYYFD